MTTAPRIACLSLLQQRESRGNSCTHGGLNFEWDVIPISSSLQAIRDAIPQYLAEYDAVALEGLSSSFRIGNQRYRHDYIWKFLGLEALGDRFSDGTALMATLERYLVSSAAEVLGERIRRQRILFLSGLNRYGAAEVLSSYSRKLLFGDLLYGFRLGIPITSFSSFVKSAPQLVRAVSQTPAHWYWPSARSSKPVMPRFHFYFRQVRVIVGDMSYFQRYSPARFDGQVIFTNITSMDDVRFFESRGVGCLVSLTPEIGGTLVPLPVLEAALAIERRSAADLRIEDYLLNRLHDLEISPRIHDFAQREEEFTLTEVPLKAGLSEAPADAELQLTHQRGVGRFCFVIHPLHFGHIKRLRSVRTLSNFVPQRLLEDAAAQLPPWPVARIANLQGADGAHAEGLIYAVPMTSKAILRFPPEFLYRKLAQVAEDAQRRGCRLMGLGAYTSVVGDAGKTLSGMVSIGVTTGNSFTVAATLKTLRQTAALCNIDLSASRGLVVGATGSIGSVCARMLAGELGQLDLVSPRPEKLLALSRQIEKESPHLKGCLRVSRNVADFIGDADVVVSTTSAVDAVIDVSSLKPGCLVLDVARPPDIKEAEAAKREDILVIESGEIMLPAGAELNYDLGLARGTIYACLAETALLALEGRFEHFTLGREIEPAKVQLIAEIGERHGFELAPIRSFGKLIRPEHLERMAEINRERAGGVPIG